MENRWSWRVLILLVVICVGGGIKSTSGINITFDPPELVIKIHQEQPVYFNLTLAYDEEDIGELSIYSDNTDIAHVIDGSPSHVASNAGEKYFVVSARFMGRTTLTLRRSSSCGGSGGDSTSATSSATKATEVRQQEKCGAMAEYSVTVLRGHSMTTLSQAFTITMSILVVFNTFIMGMQLDWKIIIAVLKKPIAPGIGFACQYIIMPLLAAAWAFALLRETPYLQFGYFAVGCAPGGGVSNFWTLLLGGNLDLSVAMTFFSNVAALAMMPFWLYTLGEVFFTQAGGDKLSIPFANIILSLVGLIGPVFGGILLAHFKPHLATKSKIYVKVFTVFIILVAVVFGSICNGYVYYLITWRRLLCGLLLPWVGFALSYGIAYLLLGQDHRNCRTIAIETGIQNAGIAIVLVQTSLKPPDNDLAMVMPICVIMFTPIPLAIWLICKIVRDRISTTEKTRSRKEMTIRNGGTPPPKNNDAPRFGDEELVQRLAGGPAVESE